MKKKRFLNILIVLVILCSFCINIPMIQANITDQLTWLPRGNIVLNGYLNDYIQNSILHAAKQWPYAGFVNLFRNGDVCYASAEFWGKAVRAASMYYRYTLDPTLKTLLDDTVADLITTKRSNGSISAYAVSNQPNSAGGDLWERKYVLLGLLNYYQNVNQNPSALQAMIDEADSIIAQIGDSPKVDITTQGWSPNKIESSSLLEPFVNLYNLTGYQRYKDFATYIVNKGGCSGANIFTQAYSNTNPYQMASNNWAKAYEMTSVFEGLLEYYRVTSNDYWKTAATNFFSNVKTQEITIIGGGAGGGECWNQMANNQCLDPQSSQMETCVNITWLKFCDQMLRLTGNPIMVDEIEKTAYNVLTGAEKADGSNFSYCNKMEGTRPGNTNWNVPPINGQYMNCCNLNGPMGLAYLPVIEVMNSSTGPVVNLYNDATASASTPLGRTVTLGITGGYPVNGAITINVGLTQSESFHIRLRVPAWSQQTTLQVNGSNFSTTPGAYADINRLWNNGDQIKLTLDMRCRLVKVAKTSGGAWKYSLIRGPVVLARDKRLGGNINDGMMPNADANGYVTLTQETSPSWAKMRYSVSANPSNFSVVDWASAGNSWDSNSEYKTFFDQTQAPAGYVWCAYEGGTYTFSAPTDVAYGASGSFFYKYGVTGAITFDNATFGGDPIVGVLKSGYYKTGAGNLAQGKTTTTSSNVSGYEGSKAVDGSFATYWCANGSSFPQWLKVDLGSQYSLGSVKQSFQDTDGSTFYYRIEGSNDNANWSPLVDRTGSGVTTSTTITETVSGAYRYVRLYVTNVNNNHWGSSKEFEVYPSAATPTATSTPAQSPAQSPAPSPTATPTPVSFNENFNDNSISSAWSFYGSGSWSEQGTILRQDSTSQGDPCKAILSNSGRTFGANHTIVAKVYVNSWVDGDSARAGVALFTGTGNGQGYNLLFHNNHSTVQFLDDGTAWGPSYTFNWTNQTWYWFKLQMSNGTLYGKVWQDGAAEPGSWPYTWTRSGRSGYPALNGGTSGHGGSCTVYFDDVTVTTP